MQVGVFFQCDSLLTLGDFLPFVNYSLSSLIVNSLVQWLSKGRTYVWLDGPCHV